MLLDSEHHGGRHGHSTMTALTKIHSVMHTNYEKGKVSAMMTTDLTAAYDTVDHSILLEKLKFYGIKNNELKLFKSYLSDRKQFVMLDTFPSSIENSLSCSLCQGSKLSGLFYTIYINELPKLFKLFNTDLYEEITGKTKNLYNDITKKQYILLMTAHFVSEAIQIS